MPRRSRKDVVVACATGLLLAFTLLMASSATAATVPVDLRVLTADGKSYVDQRQYVAPTTLRTSPKASCFGTGTGGSGKAIKLAPLTALGVLQNAAQVNRALNPILLTDHDFGFPGLGLCGIAGPIPAGDFWFLKTDRKKAQISGDQATVKRGGSVLWYRMPFTACDSNPPYACPPELTLKAPARVKPGVSFKVRVTAFDDNGKQSPVEGAKVDGASAPTDASGRTEVKLKRSRALVASKDTAVPSSPSKVCVNANLRKCPKSPGLRIVGSPQRDRITGTPGPDLVQPRQGANLVNVRGGGRDRVICLGRRHGDLVIADRSDVVRGCKTVRRR